ncbi:MAG: anti-sigma factor antagonist [Alphaproteobacteria bacterium]|nr:MAG: anti-sigma factor antagonist [Alphaproteobacteria bacterium]
MDIEKREEGDVIIVTVGEPRVDAAIAIDFKDWFLPLATAPQETVVIDMAKVEFLDSSGLGAIVAVLKALTPSGKSVALAGLSETVAKVFRLTRMDRVFTIFEDVGAALNARQTAK